MCIELFTSLILYIHVNIKKFSGVNRLLELRELDFVSAFFRLALFFGYCRILDLFSFRLESQTEHEPSNQFSLFHLQKERIILLPWCIECFENSLILFQLQNEDSTAKYYELHEIKKKACCHEMAHTHHVSPKQLSGIYTLRDVSWFCYFFLWLVTLNTLFSKMATLWILYFILFYYIWYFIAWIIRVSPRNFFLL